MARILVWDIEVSTFALTLQAYDLRVSISRFNPNHITRDWSLLSAAWKIIGEKKTHCIAVSPRDVFNDEKIVRRLHKVLSGVDILVGHNSDAFDLKKFNTRALFYGLSPIPKIPSIDTLKVARKHFKFTSNKLSYIARFLKVGAKDESPDWNKVLAGDRKEIARMKTYNIKDVTVTEKVYMVLRRFIDNHPDLNSITPIRDTRGDQVTLCPKCQSCNYIKNGFKFTSGGRYQRYFCNDCSGWFFGKKRL